MVGKCLKYLIGVHYYQKNKEVNNNGYIVRKSASESNRYAVLFKEADIGLPLDE